MLLYGKTVEILGSTFHKRTCMKNMANYAGKCFDHVSKGDKTHSRTCFCDTSGCNESPETLLFGEEPDIIYNISSSRFI